MPQISLYIDENTLREIENAAARAHMSISHWVAQQLKTKIEPGYPPQYDSLFGSIDDISFTRPDQPGFDHDTPRLEM
jgi:hypothetical protein